MLSLSKALIAPYAGLGKQQVLIYCLQKAGGQPGRVCRPGAWNIQQVLAEITGEGNGTPLQYFCLERSPSCGVHEIYDGTFSHTVIPGSGVTATYLKRKGITVYNEDEIPKLLDLD